MLWALLAAKEGGEAHFVLQDRLAMAEEAEGSTGDRLRAHAAPLLVAVVLHAAATRGRPRSDGGDGGSGGGVDWAELVRVATEGAGAAHVAAAADQWRGGNSKPLLASAARLCDEALRDVEGASVLGGSVEQRDVVFLVRAAFSVSLCSACPALTLPRDAVLYRAASGGWRDRRGAPHAAEEGQGAVAGAAAGAAQGLSRAATPGATRCVYHDVPA